MTEKLAAVASIRQPPREELIAHIRKHILEPAERGEVVEVFYVLGHSDKTSSWGWQTKNPTYSNLGALTCLHQRLTAMLAED